MDSVVSGVMTLMGMPVQVTMEAKMFKALGSSAPEEDRRCPLARISGIIVA
jgi:hypothetical protein